MIKFSGLVLINLCNMCQRLLFLVFLCVWRSMKNRELGKFSEFGLLGSILHREYMVNSFKIPILQLAFNGGKWYLSIRLHLFYELFAEKAFFFSSFSPHLLLNANTEINEDRNYVLHMFVALVPCRALCTERVIKWNEEEKKTNVS